MNVTFNKTAAAFKKKKVFLDLLYMNINHMNAVIILKLQSHVSQLANSNENHELPQHSLRILSS